MEGQASSALPRAVLFIQMSNLGKIVVRFSFVHIRQIDRLAALFLIFKQRKQLKTENP